VTPLEILGIAFSAMALICLGMLYAVFTLQSRVAELERSSHTHIVVDEQLVGVPVGMSLAPASRTDHLAPSPEKSCADLDPDEGSCILVAGHPGRHWRSMFGYVPTKPASQHVGDIR
jgi:hypothetical protein